MTTLTLAEAAAYCKCSRDHMRDLAAGDLVPATKIGKRWVFSAELLDEWIKQRCRSTIAPAPHTGGFESRSLASKLAAQRKQLTEARQKNSSGNSTIGSGASTSSVIELRSRGARSQRAG